MAAIRLPERIWSAAREHLFSNYGEHFCFFLANWTFSRGEPIFLVRELITIPDSELGHNGLGMQMRPEAILRVINSAVTQELSLIEAHNHGGSYPRFSQTDRTEMPGFIEYVHSSLPDRPYAATVWGDQSVYGEFYLHSGDRGTVDSMIVLGNQIRQIVSHDGESSKTPAAYDRQVAWFTREGQRQLSTFRVAVVGCGGTGSHVIQQLAFLGVGEFVLVDGDDIDVTNLNRVVTATPADIDTPKVIVGRRLVRHLGHKSQVLALETQVPSVEAIDALKGADVLFGCVDNDGARLVLNELALAYSIPYFDLAVGIEAMDGTVSEVGGRLAFVQPNGPCLYCMGQIDTQEASYFLSTRSEQNHRLEMGYISELDIEAPSVVSLNAAIASAAVSEFAVFVSGLRPVTPLTDYDLLGNARPIAGQWLGPVRLTATSGCIQCSVAGLGDTCDVGRYARALPTERTEPSAADPR